jgi:acetolactate synthase-1/2/3 large subunit
MLRHGVKKVFGYPGGAILPVFDAIYNSKHFDFILPRHEQGAGHMAEGYARVSGKPGVVLVTSGPGATNVITPLQDALSDGVPLVVFCGQVATSLIGSDAFQEADVVGISRSCTKWNVMVKDITELPRRINEAFKIATSGRPGPVLVDLPKDVTVAILRTPLPYKATTPGVNLGLPTNPLQATTAPTDDAAIAEAAALINQAKRPLIYAGNGVLSSPRGPELLAKLAQDGNIPVTTTLQGLGAFDELDERSLRMLGMHGSAYANMAMQEADVIIALGGRFDDRVTGKVTGKFLGTFKSSRVFCSCAFNSIRTSSESSSQARQRRNNPFRNHAQKHQQSNRSVHPRLGGRRIQPRTTCTSHHIFSTRRMVRNY